MIQIRHIGYSATICGGHARPDTPRVVRQDLGAARYRRLGVKERYKGEKPYRVCERCIAVIEQREKAQS